MKTFNGIERTGATKSENDLQFVPPILMPFDSEIILYGDHPKFFFELGSNHYYTPDAAKEKSREEFIEKIKGEILKDISKFIPERQYNRPKLIE